MISFFKEVLRQPSLLLLPEYELKLAGYLLLLAIPTMWGIGVIILAFQ